jgi:hypothetical protein
VDRSYTSSIYQEENQSFSMYFYNSSIPFNIDMFMFSKESLLFLFDYTLLLLDEK